MKRVCWAAQYNLRFFVLRRDGRYATGPQTAYFPERSLRQPTSVMRIRRPFLTLVALAGLIAAFMVSVGVLPSSADADSDLETSTQRAIEEILAEEDLPSAIWGIYVLDLETERVVFSRNADKNLIPASNLKLFTTATALDALGADHRFITRLYFDGTTNGDGTLNGDLVIKGSGDPTFGSRHEDGDPLENWARELRETGVERIEGRIIGDDDVFEDNPYAEGWDIRHIATEDYASGAGGLSYRDNLVELSVSGGGGGARVTSEPSGYVDIRNQIGSGRRGGGPFRVDRQVGTNTIGLTGRVSPSYRGTLRIPIENPTRFTLHAFRDALEAEGISLDAALFDIDDLITVPDYDNDEPLLIHVSPPMSEIARRINRESDNFYAEQVFRSFSQDGTTGGGAERVIAFLDHAGVESEGLSIRDGSGLSRKDMVTPQAIVGLLDHMNQHSARQAFWNSLPEGGGSGSTLRSRLRGVSMRGKTGSLEYVRALSGYVNAPNGRRLAFAIIANNYTTGGGTIAGAADRIVRALATGQRVPADDD